MDERTRRGILGYGTPYWLFLLVIYDIQNETSLSRKTVRLLQDFGVYLISIDDDINDEEVDCLTEIMSSMKDFMDDEGVALDDDSEFTDNEEEDADNVLAKLVAINEQAHVQISDQAYALEDLLQELDKLIGLQQVKHDVKSLCNFIRVRNMRRDQGLPVPPMSLHLVFTGNPGTGKTTVARLLAKIYKTLGVLKSGHLVEVDRSKLVAGYLGQTAIKTSDLIQSALGGVLFIDEAYSLVSGAQDSYGQEAIDTLIKKMEDHRDNLIIIVAGYPEKMSDFINSNPGFRSRFNKYINFPDYSVEDMLRIFDGMCKEAHYIATKPALLEAGKLFIRIHQNKDDNFANGRTVRNVFEQAIQNQANRLIYLEGGVTNETLQTLTKEDIEFITI